MVAVSTATALPARPRPGRSWNTSATGRRLRSVSGSRRSGLFGGGAGRPAEMITKNHKGDLGLRLPEKNKKKVEPETQYLFLSSNSYYTEVCPTTAMSSTKNVIQGRARETPLVKKKKKKKKEHSTICEEHLEPETTFRARQTEKSPSPRTQALGSSEFLNGEKKKKRKSSWPLALSPGVREKTSLDPRQVEEEPDTDLEVVLEKKGNMDEAHIDQVRRKALQEEIDRESGKTEASGTQTWTVSAMPALFEAGTQFGQWDTAGFENEDQKLKFLKLMGGFKNLSPSFGRTPDTTRRPNMALDRLAACSLQQSLQRDYARAMTRKHGGRAGLGFAASDKVFYIDRNASKSIKFED
uniref:Lysine rich nucleolar protein 1 n=1 Tax=Pipistrellus kuhlii TaxID=59472 RepID=A0A7J7QX10_PIPKU|nr:lysine rich nucleolar protein 1 [Pipistrellus kuhlii]